MTDKNTGMIILWIIVAIAVLSGHSLNIPLSVGLPVLIVAVIIGGIYESHKLDKEDEKYLADELAKLDAEPAPENFAFEGETEEQRERREFFDEMQKRYPPTGKGLFG